MSSGILTRMTELGFQHSDLADLIGRSRQHVQSICAGKYAEHLTDEQAGQLLVAARSYLDAMQKLVDEIALLA